jgi:two-component system chemotaxis sensor kinase CheA
VSDIGDQELVDEFIIESREGLESIEDDFLILEKTKDAPDPDLVNKIFRAIHSIKGSSGFLGLTKINNLSHTMENLIAKIRDGEILAESKYVDVLLQGVDLLNVMLDDIGNIEAIDISEVIVKIEKTLAGISSETIENPEDLLNEDALWNMPGDDEEKVSEQESSREKQDSPLPKKKEKKEENKSPSQKTTPKKETSAKKVQETIRINVDLLDRLMRMAGELVLVRNQQLLHVDRADAMSRSISQKLDVITTEIQEGIMKTRMQPIGNIFGKFPRVIRDMGKKLGKKIEIETSGNDVDLDKTILESLADPLTHLIRNSCDHGIEVPEDRVKAGKPEGSTIFLQAYHEGGQINIKIVDDGKGINIEAVKEKVLEKGLKTEEEIAAMSDKELANLITLPGLSTAQKVTDVSGRGVGMDVVCSSIEKLGGSLEIATEKGKGTTIVLKLPLTLAIIPSLLVRVGSERFAIPQVSLEELVCLYDEDVHAKLEVADRQEIYRLRDRLLPLVRLQEILEHREPFSEEDKMALIRKHQEFDEDQKQKRKSLVFAVLKLGNDRFGLIVDEVLGSEEIVVKPMHPALKALHCYSGATVLGDGKVALILDVEGISAFANISYHRLREEAAKKQKEEGELRSVLLFKNGQEEQFALPLTDIKRIEHVSRSRFEKAGPHLFVNVDDRPTRVVKLDEHIPVSPCQENEEMYLILPKGERSFGVLASSLLDIEGLRGQLDRESFAAEGLSGSILLEDQMTLFVDINKVGDMALQEAS